MSPTGASIPRSGFAARIGGVVETGRMLPEMACAQRAMIHGNLPKNMVWLNANENPLGPPPSALARSEDLHPENILVGCGCRHHSAGGRSLYPLWRVQRAGIRAALRAAGEERGDGPHVLEIYGMAAGFVCARPDLIWRMHIDTQANFMMIGVGRDAREFISKMPALSVAVGRPFPPLDNMLRVFHRRRGGEAEIPRCFLARLSSLNLPDACRADL